MHKITHVAIIFNGVTYSLPRPNRHHHVIHMIGGISGPHREGFLDDLGNYLSRRDAYSLACNNGQINRRQGENFYQGHELYSEDLW